MLRDPARWDAVKRLNPELSPLKARENASWWSLGTFEKLTPIPDHARLFPEDSLQGEYWLHPVGRGRIPMAAESIWHLALWFTGEGKNFQAIAEMNGLRDLTPISGQVLKIHRSLLLPIFASVPPTEAGDLSFGRDEQGEYGAYRLKKGEAIYSSVVVRFTGLLDPDDVNQMASLVARRSGIEDVSSLAVGYQVKIPRDSILPEFLPPEISGASNSS